MKKAILSLSLLLSIPYQLKAMEEAPSQEIPLLEIDKISYNEAPPDIRIRFSAGKNVYSDTLQSYNDKAPQLSTFVKQMSESGDLFPQAYELYKEVLNQSLVSVSNAEIQKRLKDKVDTLTEKFEFIDAAARVGESFVSTHAIPATQTSIANHETTIAAYTHKSEILKELVASQIASSIFEIAQNNKRIKEIKAHIALAKHDKQMASIAEKAAQQDQ